MLARCAGEGERHGNSKDRKNPPLQCVAAITFATVTLREYWLCWGEPLSERIFLIEGQGCWYQGLGPRLGLHLQPQGVEHGRPRL